MSGNMHGKLLVVLMALLITSLLCSATDAKTIKAPWSGLMGTDEIRLMHKQPILKHLCKSRKCCISNRDGCRWDRMGKMCRCPFRPAHHPMHNNDDIMHMLMATET